MINSVKSSCSRQDSRVLATCTPQKTLTQSPKHEPQPKTIHTSLNFLAEMSELDATVAKILDKERPNIKNDDDNEDELLDELENDEAALDAFREKRMQQLHDEYDSTSIVWFIYANS